MAFRFVLDTNQVVASEVTDRETDSNPRSFAARCSDPVASPDREAFSPAHQEGAIMTLNFRRLASAASDMEVENSKLRAKIMNQRKALRQLSRAHQQLWLAIRTMNPSKEALDHLVEERRELRADFAAMRDLVRMRKEAQKPALGVST